MGFQILNTEGKAIQLKELDAEACKFWGRNIDLKWYATPKENWSNWFDSIGWCIHKYENKKEQNWNDVRHELWIIQTGWMFSKTENEQIIELKQTNEYLKPYFELIYFWETSGYKPKKTND